MTDAGEPASRSAQQPVTTESELAAVENQVVRSVKLRFSLTAAEFAARVHELARVACRASGRTLREQVASLNLDDLYLATACTKRDEHAWRELSAAHFDFMREFARRFLPPAAARDVADEMIAELWTRGRLLRYEGRSTLRTWLGAVVTHAALNSHKSSSRLVAMEGSQVRAIEERADRAAGNEPANEQSAVLLREMFGEAIRGLAAEERLTLQLYYEQGLTLEELGSLMRVSAAAISRRLKRAREQLRATIEALSRQRTGDSAQALRAGLELGRIELDLEKLFGESTPGESTPIEQGRSVV